MHTHTHTHTHICKNTFFLLYGFLWNILGETEQWSTKAQEGCIYVSERFIDNPHLGTGYIVHKESNQHCSDMLLF